MRVNIFSFTKELTVIVARMTIPIFVINSLKVLNSSKISSTLPLLPIKVSSKSEIAYNVLYLIGLDYIEAGVTHTT